MLRASRVRQLISTVRSDLSGFAREQTPASGATALSGGISPHDTWNQPVAPSPTSAAPTAASAPAPKASRPSAASSSTSKSSSAPAKSSRASSAPAKKSVHPAPRRRAPAQKSEELPYDELWDKLPKSLTGKQSKQNDTDEAELVSVFL